MNTKIKLLTGALSVLIMSCNTGEEKNQQSTSIKENTSKEEAKTFQNKGHELVYNMVQKVGNYSKLYNKKDVVYTYSYTTPDGKTDITTEKYLFNGELSYGEYKKHERTSPDLEGSIEQGYDGNEYWIKHDEKVLTDEKLLDKVKFNRPTNFYWFTMMQKLLDNGLHYEYLGERTISENDYDIVKVTFDLNGKENTDIYQLYINKETLLVNQFLFTVVDYGVIDEPFLMVMEYEEIDGLLIPTQRKYKKSTWDAGVTEGPWINVTWSDIQFGNGLTIEDFKK
jgi:hypothetical protein